MQTFDGFFTIEHRAPLCAADELEFAALTAEVKLWDSEAIPNTDHAHFKRRIMWRIPSVLQFTQLAPSKTAL